MLNSYLFFLNLFAKCEEEKKVCSSSSVYVSPDRILHGPGSPNLVRLDRRLRKMKVYVLTTHVQTVHCSFAGGAAPFLKCDAIYRVGRPLLGS